MPDINAQLTSILDSSTYPPELRVKALDLLAQGNVQADRLKTEDVARVENVRIERMKIWLNTPIIAAVAGLLTLGATQVLSIIQNKETATLANVHARTLEERKFQFEMIRSALSDSKNSKQRANSLLFLIDSKILDGLDTQALKKWAEEKQEETPAFENNSPHRLGIEREFRRPVSEAVVADLTKKAQESGTHRWMQHAISEMGVTEIPGPDKNERIMEYARFVGLQSLFTDDDIPWSGLFINYVLKKAGFDNFPAEPARNRSWVGWGQAIAEPKFGALAIFWSVSPQSGAGHVGFIVGVDADALIVLGGNQSNSVSVARILRSRLLGVRMPSATP